MNPEALRAIARPSAQTRDAPGLRRGRAVNAATSVPVWPVVFASPQFVSSTPSRYCRLDFCTKKGTRERYDQVVELREAPIAAGTYDVPEMSPYAPCFADAFRIDVAEYIELRSILPLPRVTILGLKGCSRLRGRLTARLHRLLDGAVVIPSTRLTVSVAGHSYQISFLIDATNEARNGSARVITPMTVLAIEGLSPSPSVPGSLFTDEAVENYFQMSAPATRHLFDLIRAKLTDPASLSLASALLYGLPGNGKSMFANMATARLNALAIETSLVALDLVTAIEYLDTQVIPLQPHPSAGPATLLFIDEIDSEQAVSVFTIFHLRVRALQEGPYRVFILAATNRLATLPLSVVTVSFPLYVEFRAPEYEQRVELLRGCYKELHGMLEGELGPDAVEEVDSYLNCGITRIEDLAEHLEGLSYADIASIFSRLRHFVQAAGPRSLSLQQVRDALMQLVASTRPSSLLSFDVVQVHGAQVGGLTQELATIHKMISSSFTNSLLIYGEPGCGKSQIGRSLSSVLHFPLLSVASTQLIGSYVGETEKAIDRMFRVARASQPVLIFWDEIDAVFPDSVSHKYMDRVITAFSACLDDILGTKVFLIAATNRIDMIHAKVLARFSHKLEIKRPSTYEQALSIFQACLGPLPTDSTLDEAVPACVGKLVGQTGAEIAYVVRCAALNAIRRCVAARAASCDASADNEVEALTGPDLVEAVGRERMASRG